MVIHTHVDVNMSPYRDLRKEHAASCHVLLHRALRTAPAGTTLTHTHREWGAWLVICPGMGVNRWCVCLVGRVLCANLCRCRSRVLPYIHILNRQLQQLPVPVCRLRAVPHTCGPPLPCVSSPVTVCASAMNIR